MDKIEEKIEIQKIDEEMELARYRRVLHFIVTSVNWHCTDVR